MEPAKENKEPLSTFLTRDILLLRAFLRDDPARAGYLLGDLDPHYFEKCRWFVAAAYDRPVALLLSFEALDKPVLLSHGAPDGIAAILDTFGHKLAKACSAKIPIAHREQFVSFFSIVYAQALWTMELTNFCPVISSGAVPLSESNLPDMLPLYDTSSENYFEAGQMRAGVYFGRYKDGRLLSIAGTHAYSPREHIAILGNIVTAVDSRGQGHARAVTSRLIEELRQRGCTTIALQVAADNEPAIAVYRSLGFIYRDIVLQARCERR
jgi:GNAT superfamily N-acetyltransferase